MSFNQTNVEMLIQHIPIFGPLMNASFANTNKNMHEYDCHPHVMQRLNSELDTLRYELNKNNVDPKLEKEIKRQINELESLKNKITEITSDQSKAQKIYATYAAYVDKKLPNGMSKVIEEEIDKAIDGI